MLLFHLHLCEIWDNFLYRDHSLNAWKNLRFQQKTGQNEEGSHLSRGMFERIIDKESHVLSWMPVIYSACLPRAYAKTRDYCSDPHRFSLLLLFSFLSFCLFPIFLCPSFRRQSGEHAIGRDIWKWMGGIDPQSRRERRMGFIPSSFTSAILPSNITMKMFVAILCFGIMAGSNLKISHLRPLFLGPKMLKQ